MVIFGNLETLYRWTRFKLSQSARRGPKGFRRNLKMDFVAALLCLPSNDYLLIPVDFRDFR